MNCYNHNTVPAVAICKNCSKGLCMECLTELENGIACKGKCEEEVNYLNTILSRSKNKNAYQKVSESYKRNSLIYLLLGLVFIAFGILEMKKGMALFMLPAGAVFLLGAFFNYSTGKKYLKKD